MNRFAVAKFHEISGKIFVILRTGDFVFGKIGEFSPFGNFIFPLADSRFFVEILFFSAHRKQRFFMIEPFRRQRPADKNGKKRVEHESVGYGAKRADDAFPRRHLQHSRKTLR